MHYHIMAARRFEEVLANLRFDEYNDALQTYASLSNALFAHAFEGDELAIEHAAEATEYGQAPGALVGNKAICFVFATCDEEEYACDWLSPTWN
jgi:N-acetylglucosamine kinase-like BadF-type ATPase